MSAMSELAAEVSWRTAAMSAIDAGAMSADEIRAAGSGLTVDDLVAATVLAVGREEATSLLAVNQIESATLLTRLARLVVDASTPLLVKLRLVGGGVEAGWLDRIDAGDLVLEQEWRIPLGSLVSFEVIA